MSTNQNIPDNNHKNNTMIPNMNIEQKIINQIEKKEQVSFPIFFLEVVSDILIGVGLGLFVNMISTFIGKLFGLKKIGTIIIQLLMISLVLYMIKVDSRYLFSTWEGEADYGIIFTAVFLAVQPNMINFFTDIYHIVDDKFGAKFEE